MILSQVAKLQDGQILLQGLQFLHLPGKDLLVILPHGILQEPGTEGRVSDYRNWASLEVRRRGPVGWEEMPE